MTFPIREASRTLGEPISLYFFRYGDTPDAYYAYTDCEQQVEHEFDPQVGLVVFQPIPVDRGEITSSGSLDKAAMEIRTPQNAELAQLFSLHPPSQIVTVVIFQGHEGDTDFRVEWMGRVLGSSREGNEAVYTCEPVSTSMKRPGLRRNYQYQCPHVLYSQGPGLCNADREARSILRSATGVAGALVTFGAIDNPDMYIGGIAEWTAPDGRKELRSIVRRADGLTFVFSGIALGLTPGVVVKLSAGCDHKMDGDCLNLHNNVQNFGGQPWIPTENPLGIKNNYY